MLWLWQKSYAYMYIEQTRTYEIKKVAFKFNFLFLGYNTHHEEKLNFFFMTESEHLCCNDLSCGKLVLLFLRLNFIVSSLVSGKTEILGNGNVMQCFNIIASLTVECGYNVIRS